MIECVCLSVSLPYWFLGRILGSGAKEPQFARDTNSCLGLAAQNSVGIHSVPLYERPCIEGVRSSFVEAAI